LGGNSGETSIFKEDCMKKKQFLGFAILIMVIITMAGCAIFFGSEYKTWAESRTETFPEEFIGTWERNYDSRYTSTLTFTSTTLQASNQDYHWVLNYGYTYDGKDFYSFYYIHTNTNPNYQPQIKIKLDEDGNLFIDEGEDTSRNVDGVIIHRDSSGSITGATGLQLQRERSEDDWNGSWKRKQ
jgi:hypothetical protein